MPNRTVYFHAQFERSLSCEKEPKLKCLLSSKTHQIFASSTYQTHKKPFVCDLITINHTLFTLDWIRAYEHSAFDIVLWGWLGSKHQLSNLRSREEQLRSENWESWATLEVFLFFVFFKTYKVYTWLDQNLEKRRTIMPRQLRFKSKTGRKKSILCMICLMYVATIHCINCTRQDSKIHNVQRVFLTNMWSLNKVKIIKAGMNRLTLKKLS